MSAGSYREHETGSCKMLVCVTNGAAAPGRQVKTTPPEFFRIESRMATENDESGKSPLRGLLRADKVRSVV